VRQWTKASHAPWFLVSVSFSFFFFFFLYSVNRHSSDVAYGSDEQVVVRQEYKSSGLAKIKIFIYSQPRGWA
jgi:hypothetical protein